MTSRTVRMCAVGLMALVVTAMTFTGAAAQQDSSRSQGDDRSPRGIKNIILVHGAWADGSSWSKIIPLLESRGHHVVAVQNHLSTFEDDVATTRRAIANQDGPVLLVGHSYGGAVITQVGTDPKVAGLVYVAAFAPDAGESPLQFLTAYPTPVGNELRQDQFGFITLTPEGIRDAFAQDLSAAEHTVLIATQGPTSPSSGGTPITTVAWKTKPSWYVVARRDRTIAPELQRMFATRMNATTIELVSSHVPMLSRPYEVAAFIRRAASQAGDQ